MTNRHLLELSADNHNKIIAFPKLGDVSKNQAQSFPVQFSQKTQCNFSTEELMNMASSSHVISNQGIAPIALYAVKLSTKIN